MIIPEALSVKMFLSAHMFGSHVMCVRGGVTAVMLAGRDAPPTYTIKAYLKLFSCLHQVFDVSLVRSLQGAAGLSPADGGNISLSHARVIASERRF